MEYFSRYLQESKKYLKQLVTKLSQKYGYVSILGTDISGKMFGISNELLRVGETRLVERGFVARVYNGTGYAEYSFNSIGANNVDLVAKEIDEIVENSKELFNIQGCEKVVYPMIEEEKISKEFERESVHNTVSEAKIMKTLKDISTKMAAYDKAIVTRSVSFEICDISKVFVSNNKDLSQFYNWCAGTVVAVAMTEKGPKYDYHGKSGDSFDDTIAAVEEMAMESVKTAIMLGTAEDTVPGEYDCIVLPDVTGLIAHEAFGHGVEMDMFVKNRAKAPLYMNKYVANPSVSMYDGADVFEQTSSYFFDDEGTLAHKTLVIKDGILVSGINDIMSALRLGVAPTGNGKRESFERKTYTRMTNTYFTSGDSKYDDMVQSIKKGYIIHGAESGMEDPKNWGIQCVAHYGEEVIDGKLTGKVVAPIVMTGYVPDLLGSITARTNELDICGTGYCGKGHKEWVKVSDGGPCMKVKVKIG